MKRDQLLFPTQVRGPGRGTCLASSMRFRSSGEASSVDAKEVIAPESVRHVHDAMRCRKDRALDCLCRRKHATVAVVIASCRNAEPAA